MAPGLILLTLMAANSPGAPNSGSAPPPVMEPEPPSALAPPQNGSPPSAAKEPGRGLVVVLVPEVQDEVTRNAMARITGELAAAPFGIATDRVDPSSDVMAQVETAGRELAPVAAFAIVRETDRPGSVAVWVSNRITRTTTVQRVPIRAGDVDGAAAHLAIEAVELVRASMAGLWPGANRTAPPTVIGATPAAPPPLEARFQVGVGVSVFSDFDATPAFWTPTVAISYGRRDQTRLRLLLEGLGPGTDVTAADGSGGARLERTAAELGLVRSFRPGKTLQPLLSLGVGGQALTAQGTGAPASRLRRDTAWSALAAAGGGGLVALGSHLALVAEAQLLVVLAGTTVQVVDTQTTDVAHLDRLSFNAEVGLLATF